MNELELEKIKAAIFEVGILFTKATQPTEAQVNAYARALIRYSPQQITYAFNQVILAGSAFFPSLAEVLKHLRHETIKKEELAPLIANEILQAIRTFGQYDEDKMNASLSEDARLTLRLVGGTSDIRNSDQDNIGTTKAQLERAAKGALASRENKHKSEKLDRLGIISSIDFKTIDYSGFLEKDA